MKYFLLSLIVPAFLISCGDQVNTFNSHTNDPFSYNTANIDTSGVCGAEFASMYAVLESSCIRCHQNSYSYTDIEDWRNGVPAKDITPGDPENSLIYSRLNGTGLEGGMPPSNTAQLNDQEIESFALFINCLGDNP